MALLGFIGRGLSKVVRSDEGAYYMIGRMNGDDGKMRCVKSTDPGTIAFTTVGEGTAPVADNADSSIVAFHYDEAHNHIN